MNSLINDNKDMEALFPIEDMFVSLTDKKGIIQSGNEVFVRVSGFSRNKLIGSPHNLIRHADMPKSVFKLFWSKLQKNQPIVAYVKNKDASGKYYWVLATAFPIEGGYFSIRIKPSVGILPKIESAYTETAQFEKENGIEAGLNFLLQKVQDLGFESYEDFMVYSMFEEFHHRMKAIVPADNFANPKNSSLVNSLAGMHVVTAVTAFEFVKLSFGAQGLLKCRDHWREKNEVFTKAFESLDFLSVNMSIGAHKLGKEGSTLSVIAETFQSTSFAIISNFKSFTEKASVAFGKLPEILTDLGCLTMQTEMAQFYLTEVIEKSKLDLNGMAFESSFLEVTRLLQASESYFSESAPKIRSYLQSIRELRNLLQEVQVLFVRLDLIRAGGELESSRSIETQSTFKPFIEHMNTIVEQVMKPAQQLDVEITKLEEFFRAVALGLRGVDHSYSELKLRQASIEQLLLATKTSKGA